MSLRAGKNEHSCPVRFCQYRHSRSCLFCFLLSRCLRFRCHCRFSGRRSRHSAFFKPRPPATFSDGYWTAIQQEIFKLFGFRSGRRAVTWWITPVALTVVKQLRQTGGESRYWSAVLERPTLGDTYARLDGRPFAVPTTRRF